jgi:hypothetical protein
LNIDFGINNERQVCKIGALWWGGGYLWEGGGGMEEMKVSEYGLWASYSYTK